jgi:NAD(P)-dependent dehydrogenase (short-subunit alcohol dehydrogenase family)
MYLQKYDLHGRTAVVTGGGQGIGLACAQALAEAGARTIVLDLLPERVETAVSELKGKGLVVAGYQLDVTRSAQVDEVAARIASEHGSASILVNNAGVAHSNVRSEDTSDDHWRFHMDVNVDGVFWCCRAFGRQMLAVEKGSIVNIGSMSGFIVNKPQPQSFYNASKAAVHHLTKSLAAEWGQRGVRVNAVAPTYIETPLTRFGMEDQSMYPTWIEMTPMGRVGQPEEIASVVLFLASDAASLLTGSIVLADGGYTCW